MIVIVHLRCNFSHMRMIKRVHFFLSLLHCGGKASTALALARVRRTFPALASIAIARAHLFLSVASGGSKCAASEKCETPVVRSRSDSTAVLVVNQQKCQIPRWTDSDSSSRLTERRSSQDEDREAGLGGGECFTGFRREALSCPGLLY